MPREAAFTLEREQTFLESVVGFTVCSRKLIKLELALNIVKNHQETEILQFSLMTKH